MSHGVYVKDGAAYCGCCKLPYENCRVHVEELELSKSDEGKAKLRNRYYAMLSERTGVVRDESKRLAGIGVPVEIRKAVVSPKETGALDAARKFIRSDKLALLVWGSTGTGKTTAACRVAYEFCAKHENPTYEPARLVFSREIARASDFDDNASALVGRAKGVPLLVLDDLGQEGTDWGRAKVAEVLLYRLDNSKRTIITTNLTPADIAKLLGAALVDRLKAHGETVMLVGGSMRTNGNAGNSNGTSPNFNKAAKPEVRHG